MWALDLMKTRMYTSWAHLREGWSKNMYLGAKRSLPDNWLLQALVPSLLMLPFVAWLIPPLLLLQAALGVTTLLTGPAVVATIASLTFWILISIGMEIPWYWGLGYPIGAAAGAFLATRSILRGGRKVEWKGRVYGTSVQ
jgi:hypothetical protein